MIKTITKKKLCIISILVAFILTLSFNTIMQKNIQKTSADVQNINNEWEHDLYTPTMIQKINNTYFIVDCWHHRVIYNDNLTDNISNWKTMTDKIKGGHSIASDGQLYLVDDTDNSSIRVFIKQNNTFTQTQIIEDVQGRPHYILYDNKSKLFYVICSLKGEIRVMQNDNGKLKTVQVKTINELLNWYVRSINIIDGYLYCVSGPNKILKLKYDDLSFDIINQYDVPANLGGMNFITKIDDYFYISIYGDYQGTSPSTFIRTKNLEDLSNSKYENLYDKFNFKGTPYYISFFDNKYFITEIDASSGIKSFEVKDNEINNIKTLYYFEKHSESSETRKQSAYK